MNARGYRVNLSRSPLDFPPIMGLGETTVSWRSEPPHIINNKVLLKITKAFILTESYANKQHIVLKVQSVYEIPVNEIKTREDVYEFYKDATLSLNDVYQYILQTQLPTLPSRSFPYPPIENYQKEIDRVFDLLNSQN